MSIESTEIYYYYFLISEKCVLSIKVWFIITTATCFLIYILRFLRVLIYINTLTGRKNHFENENIFELLLYILSRTKI